VGDEELAMLAAAGDSSAFEILVERHRDFMYSICRKITCNDQDAVDALQDALVTSWRHIGSFECRSSIRTWLFRVATNAAVDEVRRRARRQDQADAAVGDRASSLDVEAMAVARTTVDWALARLPPQFRAAVVLREYYGLTYQEIAETLDIPIDTVKSRISRGRQALVGLLLPSMRGETSRAVA
jgi:RNA polymerase sigma-70 factor (ECF subfamily)